MVILKIKYLRESKTNSMSFERNSVPITDIFDRKHVKVCHTSAFHTISVRSVYMKKSSNSGSILAKLNDTMPAKQYFKKNHNNSNKNKQTNKLVLLLESSNLQLLSIRYVWTVVNIYLLPELQFFFGFKCKKGNFEASLLNKMHNDTQFSFVFKL